LAALVAAMSCRRLLLGRHRNVLCHQAGPETALFPTDKGSREVATGNQGGTDRSGFFPLLRSTPAASVITTLHEGRVVEVNEAFERLSGFSRSEVLGRSTLELGVWPEPARRRLWIEQIEREGKARDFQVLMRSARGEYRTVLLSGERIDSEEGPLVLSVAVDVTGLCRAEEELRNALREKEMLRRELRHRVRNNLQVVSSLLALHAASGDREDLEKVRRRVHDLALVHKAADEAGTLWELDLAECARWIADTLAAMHREESIEVKTRSAPVVVHIDQLVPCGLIIVELVRNSLQHAFSAGETGKVRIDTTAGEDGWVELAVIDNGRGLPPGFDAHATDSLGFMLVAGLVEHQLSGNLTVQSGGGTRVTVRFPKMSCHRSDLEY
jgi:PAS domain S-box-containing protein